MRKHYALNVYNDEDRRLREARHVEQNVFLALKMHYKFPAEVCFDFHSS